jgi:hypothetical protein
MATPSPYLIAAASDSDRAQRLGLVSDSRNYPRVAKQLSKEAVVFRRRLHGLSEVNCTETVFDLKAAT